MEEAVPGASVFPTRTRPGDTQIGNDAAGGWTPVPARDMTVGEFVALLVTDALPVTLPVAAGANITFRVAVFAGARTVPADTPLGLKPAPELLTFEIVTSELPEFVSVTASVLLAVVFMFPKLKLVGLALSRYVAAFTVSVAALLVALPAELLTATVNCAPVSVAMVAAVV